MSQKLDFSIVQPYFKLSENGLAEPIFSTPASALLQPEIMKQTLDLCQRELKARSLELPVSFLGNAFFGIIASTLIFMASDNKKVHLSLEHYTFQIELKQGFIYGAFRIDRLEAEELSKTDRQGDMAAHWIELLTRSLVPLLKIAANEAGVKPELIWNQFAGRLQYLKDVIMDKAPREQVKEQFLQDMETLLGLEPAWFQRRKNPFHYKLRYIGNPWTPGKSMMIRSSCCMYYDREGGQYCYNCPKLTEAQRAERRKEIEAKLPSA